MTLHIILGSEGFLGKNLVERLELEKNNMILKIDKIQFSQSGYYSLDLTKVSGKEINDLVFEFLIGKKVSNISVWHYASVVGVSENESKSTLNETTKINLTVYDFILAFKTISKIPIDLIFASTSEIFGNINITNKTNLEIFRFDRAQYQIISNGIFKNPLRNEYVFQKEFAERIYCNLNIPLHIIRYFNVFGQYQSPSKGVNARFLNELFRDTPLSEIPTNQSIRTYTPIDEAMSQTLYGYSKMKEITYQNIFGDYVLNPKDLLWLHYIVYIFVIDNISLREFPARIWSKFKLVYKNTNLKELKLKGFKRDNIKSIIKEDEIKERWLSPDYLELNLSKESQKTYQFILELIFYYCFNLELENPEKREKILKTSPDIVWQLVGSIFTEEEIEKYHLIQEVDSNSKFVSRIFNTRLMDLTKENILSHLK